MEEKEIKPSETAFHLCVADRVVAVECVFPSTRRYCEDYLTDAPAQDEIRITVEDIQREGEKIPMRQAGRRGCLPYLEVLVLCRRVAQILPQYGAMLFHGSVLAVNGEGVLFTAKSGTGKSTHTGLWRAVYGEDVIMVNDDKPFLKVSPQGVWAYGSPWQGKHRLGTNMAVPLEAICILSRGVENRIQPLAPREALPMLMQQTFQPDDPAEVLRKMQMVDQLSRQVKLYRLECNMDPEAAEVAYRAIFEQEREECP